MGGRGEWKRERGAHVRPPSLAHSVYEKDEGTVSEKHVGLSYPFPSLIASTRILSTKEKIV